MGSEARIREYVYPSYFLTPKDVSCLRNSRVDELSSRRKIRRRDEDEHFVYEKIADQLRAENWCSVASSTDTVIVSRSSESRLCL